MTNIETALPALFKLREFGVILSMDDFGTGASSLQHIATLPLGSVKIDRSFVARLGQRCTESAVVQAIALIGNLLDREIVAEGVESADQLAHLITLGCHRGQGYFLSRPLDAKHASDLLKCAIE
jgi:EAL domain-containing protein (putative c-di-GMP-specific phosphodiesterase class I)